MQGIFLADRADVMLGYCSSSVPVMREIPGLVNVPLPPSLTVGPAYGLIVLSDQPLAFTCVVCGMPTSTIPLPVLSAPDANICSSCGQTVCAKHYSRSRKICVRCAKQSDSWCGTPGMKF